MKTKETETEMKLVKGSTRMVFPKKIQTIGREAWTEQMEEAFKGLKLSTEQWEEIYNIQAQFYFKAFTKGYPIAMAGLGNITPTEMDHKLIAVEENEELELKLPKGVYPTFYSNTELRGSMN
jgi:hypothetical protein